MRKDRQKKVEEYEKSFSDDPPQGIDFKAAYSILIRAYLRNEAEKTRKEQSAPEDIIRQPTQELVVEGRGMAIWIKFLNEENNHLPAGLNLNEVTAITHDSKQKRIIISALGYTEAFNIRQKHNPEAYQQILDYVKQTTGHDLT